MTIEELGKHTVIIDFNDLFTKDVTNIFYKEGEIGTASIKAKLVKKRTPIDLTGCRVILNIMNEKGEPIVDTATILNEKEGIVEIKFAQVALRTGISFFELTIVDANYNSKKSPKLAYRVLDSLSEDAIIESERYPILVNMIKDVDNLHTVTEGLIQENNQLKHEMTELGNSLTQAELVRDSNEQIRISNENSRISNMNKINSDVAELISTSTKKIDDKVVDIQSQLDTRVNEKFTTFDGQVNDKMAELNTVKENVITTSNECTKKVDDKIVNIQEQLDTKTTEKFEYVDNTLTAKVTEIDTAKGTIVSEATTKISEVESKISGIETRFNALSPEESTNAEVQLARTDAEGVTHASLHDRLLKAETQGNVLWETVEG